MFDTICAISSGIINQPIGIVRLSGPAAFSIVKKVFSGKAGKHHTISYGFIKDGLKQVDEVLVSWFQAPHTFTGEDVVEINAHGGVVVLQQILELILKSGARQAERGEFTRRAFLNGKLDLVKAEAIHDLIMAKTASQATLAVSKFSGKTSHLLKALQDDLVNIIATIETNIDYPEYTDIKVLTNDELLPQLIEIEKSLSEISAVSAQAKPLYEGVSVAIVGRPNAGKSSLLNALLDEERAIVSNLPGTTRDIVEGRMQIGQVLFNFKDTAGVHTTSRKIEQLGIEKSLQAIKDADLVIHVIDASKPLSDDDLKLQELAKLKIYLPVANKSDLKVKNKPGWIPISAKTGEIAPLLSAIMKQFHEINLSDERIVANARQISLLNEALQSTASAIESLRHGVDPSIVIIDITKAWEATGSVLGNLEQNSLLDTMFKNFCLGK